jgi:glycosyltransferase involved in cell wall biosynthesis
MSNRFILNDVVFSIGDIYKLKEINEPIRVLHCIRGMNVGGAETFIMNVYRNINREEFQFDFLASKDGYFDNEIQKLGGKIYKIPYLTDVGQFKYVKELKNFFNNHKEYKIIHSHIDQVSGIILETAKKCNMPVRISHSHSSKNMNGLLGKVYKKYLQSKIIKNATEILACSQEAANWLFRSKAKDAIIVKNGIDIKKYKYSEEKRQRIRKELEISDDIIVIGHVGSFLAVKNHEFIIDVYNEYLKLNPKAMLVLVGQGILLDKMYDKVKNLNLEEKVKFLGLRNDTDFLYSAFDVFLFPSLYEGLSLALIEAHTSSLNIFASNTIDKATNITGTINFLDLNSGAKKWAENILKSDKKRNDNIKKIEDSGYNISNTVDILKDIYISAIKSINK